MAVQNKTAKILFRVILSVLIALSIASITATILLQGIAALIESTLGIFGITTLGAEALGAFFFLIFGKVRRTKENNPASITLPDHINQRSDLEPATLHAENKPALTPNVHDSPTTTPVIQNFTDQKQIPNKLDTDPEIKRSKPLEDLSATSRTIIVPPPSLPLIEAISAGKFEDALHILHKDPTAKKQINQFKPPVSIRENIGGPLSHLLEYAVQNPTSLDSKHFKPLLKALFKAGADWNFMGIAGDFKRHTDKSIFKLTVYIEILEQLSPYEFWYDPYVYSTHSFFNDYDHERRTLRIKDGIKLAKHQQEFLSLCEKKNTGEAKKFISLLGYTSRANTCRS